MSPTSTRALLLGVLGATLAACEATPPLKIGYELSKGPSQECMADNCDGVQLWCDPVLSIRIVDPALPHDPADPTVDNSLLSVCQRFRAQTLCGMQQVNLPFDAELPARRLAVQVALYNADDLPKAADGEPICPRTLQYDANNLAIASEPYPAVAGQSYFSPGDAETVVTLGCNDLTVLARPSCRGADLLKITASADDFVSGVGLQPPLSEQVELYVGEPTSYFDAGSEEQFHKLPLLQLDRLARVAGSGTPAWHADLQKTFAKSVCVVVREFDSATTSSVSCRRFDGESPLDLRGILLERPTITAALNALQLSAFPLNGMVIGMVVDSLGKPVKDVVVRPSSGTVQYLSEGRIAGASTSSNGIFLSLDTPYNTSWSAPGTTGGYGGIIDGYATVIILQPDAQTQGRGRAKPDKSNARPTKTKATNEATTEAATEPKTKTKLPTLQLQL